MQKKCVVSFSGGQDSTTTAAWAKTQFEQVILLGFDYNQKHKIELTQAKIIAQKLNLPLHIIKIDFLDSIVESALLSSSTQAVNDTHQSNKTLPASFVPNRNALFITIVHSFAQKIGAENIALGVSEQDYSGYPDCRDYFIKNIELTLNLGSESNIKIHTPLMKTTKAQEFNLAKELGVLDIIIKDTHTCYNGNREILYDWGYGCGECNACILRKNAYEEFIKKYQKIQ
ncbi:7-cyano-7-deazaguanine synthase QueC [Helicobacter cappadocius]|uniref:7-cyano-7-deazaguanine synthase n=1 Tax=Helicobacter cappadocius TaxID=3063998 RepID=A0AA90PQU6_9HELI|nr:MULTISPECIES: 7-cyano-7-deazaguanine synthase QueC [unclassified Helicobacter]MDO7253309.1 7-cyano-7-deazaguanine synthase QueC [Helicobacter sp. faydin-H75]MDP2539261.1 7-cyano-7-deazaguanine synthase QueC [Helicobacter sp. faydin-H76]